MLGVWTISPSCAQAMTNSHEPFSGVMHGCPHTISDMLDLHSRVSRPFPTPSHLWKWPGDVANTITHLRERKMVWQDTGTQRWHRIPLRWKCQWVPSTVAAPHRCCQGGGRTWTGSQHCLSSLDWCLGFEPAANSMNNITTEKNPKQNKTEKAWGWGYTFHSSRAYLQHSITLTN